MLNRIKALLVAAITTATLSLSVDANAADGRIVANNDEWTLSNSGYGAPDDPDQFILSSIAWMAGLRPHASACRSITPRSLTTMGRQTLRTAGSSAAFRLTSGPMPVGSPVAMAIFAPLLITSVRRSPVSVALAADATAKASARRE